MLNYCLITPPATPDLLHHSFTTPEAPVASHYICPKLTWLGKQNKNQTSKAVSRITTQYYCHSRLLTGKSQSHIYCSLSLPTMNSQYRWPPIPPACINIWDNLAGKQHQYIQSLILRRLPNTVSKGSHNVMKQTTFLCSKKKIHIPIMFHLNTKIHFHLNTTHTSKQHLNLQFDNRN